MPELRFGLLVVPDAPFPTLAERWRRVEELGFDLLFVADHYRHTRNASLPWFDGWTALAAMALQTTTVRIGPLVANPILRGPAVLAKAAAALDHLSDGRLELAIGKGVEEFDHRATGTPFWSPRERATRFREYVQVVDGVLRSWETPFSFEGRYYRTQETSLAPAPVQRPRPPITVGGQSPTVRRVAAERADCWNTFALGDVPFDEILETVRHQNLELDELCTELGREPMKLRRSLVLWKPLDHGRRGTPSSASSPPLSRPELRNSSSCGHQRTGYRYSSAQPRRWRRSNILSPCSPWSIRRARLCHPVHCQRTVSRL